jgi:hypothetical protein
MQIQKIYIGGWFQRTTLHLTEIWDFLKHLKSGVGFDQKTLAEARDRLDITEVSRQTAGLEYILIKTSVGITYRIYEDGLIILEKPYSNLEADFEAIRSYYDDKLSKSLSLIFSKGAPVPKELANIKTILPYIVTTKDGIDEEIRALYNKQGEEIYFTISSKQVDVYRSSGLIIINDLLDEELSREVIESQIFFREFKTQLHRYLNIHRILWEKIAMIKEKGSVKGTDIDTYQAELGDYQKTIELIGARIKQMGTYLDTRKKITDLKKIDDYLSPLFQFKFETLDDTHEYIKDLWDMTKDYLDSAMDMFKELQEKSTKNTISSLQLITTIGVVAAILGYLGRDKLPVFTQIGLVYFILLLAMTGVLNFVISRIYKRRKYKIEGSKIVKDIK